MGIAKVLKDAADELARLQNENEELKKELKELKIKRHEATEAVK